MLRFLRVSHLAVIDTLEVELEPGFNVLTGETGAGKSMLIQAIGLLMGGRAAPDLIRTGESQATVQAVFEQPDGQELILRREITAQGRSRAFLNDTLVTIGAMKEQTAALVELHGQHEHQTLLDPQSHLDLLDGSARLPSSRAEVAAAYRRWRELRDELEALQMDEREKAARLDLLNFQVAELDRAALRLGEDDELMAERHLLANAEKSQRLCAEDYLLKARRLSSERRTAAVSFSRAIQGLLAELAMGEARFEMRFLESGDAPESSWGEHGFDRAEWYLSTNVGEDLRPLARVASGGELSRVMLAIRNLGAAVAPGKTLVFDEIDAGIGGRVADIVGKKLRRLGDQFQVLCVTHFPQIAAQGPRSIGSRNRWRTAGRRRTSRSSPVHSA